MRRASEVKMEIENPYLKELYETLGKKYEQKFVDENWHIITESYLIAKGKYTESVEQIILRTGYDKEEVVGLNDKMIQDEIRRIRKLLVNDKNMPPETAKTIIKELDQLEKVAFVKAV